MKENNFKNTELGIVPQDWVVNDLGKCISYIRTGLNPRVHFKLNTPDANGYYITVRELKGLDIIVDDKTDRINDYAVKRIDERSKLKIGDILFSGTGTIGRTAIVKNKPTNWGIKEGIYAITPNYDTLNSKYLIYYLRTPVAQELLDTMASGSTVRSVPMAKLKEIPLILPPTITEQNHIANALSDMDSLIQSLDKLIEKKRNIKQGAMQNLLTGKKRLNGFTGEWVEKQLWELTAWDKKFNEVDEYKQKKVYKYPYALANVLEEMEDSNGDVVLLSTGKYDGYTTIEKAGNYLCEGEVVTIPWGGVANVKYAKGKFVTADNRIATSLDTDILSNKYLYFFLLNNTDLLNSFYRGASIKHPSMADVLDIEIKFPKDIAEQLAIVEILSDMDAEIQAFEAKLAKYVAIKEGMMQQLLTGKIRLLEE